jgi:transcriptional regulator with XRE-family HTH domain
MRSRSSTRLPAVVKTVLRKLGSDMNEARRRQRISTAAMSKRAMISRPTLTRVEKGDASVSLGVYASVLYVLGMSERIADIADATHDSIGLEVNRQHLPQRIHVSKPKGTRNAPKKQRLRRTRRS